MSWHFVERWLQKVNQHSTLIGKFWITFLIVFRIVVVSSVGDRVYSDEQSEFKCNTQQVGCPNVCFNKFSPISHIRFWSFQIILVTTPSIIFMVYSAHHVKKKPSAKEKSSISHTPSPTKRQDAGKDGTNEEDFKKRKKSQMVRPNSLAATNDMQNEPRKTVIQEMFGDDKSAFTQHYILYTFSVIIRGMVESIFIYLQYHLFQFEVHELYKCNVHPCPNVVDCFVSRPMEKTVFLWFMLIIDVISLFLNVIELLYLIWQFAIRRRKFERRRRRLRRNTTSEAKKLNIGDAEIVDGGTLCVPHTAPPTYRGAMNMSNMEAIELVEAVNGHPIAMSFSLDDAVIPEHAGGASKYGGHLANTSSADVSSRSNNLPYQVVPNEFYDQPYLANPRTEKPNPNGYV